MWWLDIRYWMVLQPTVKLSGEAICHSCNHAVVNYDQWSSDMILAELLYYVNVNYVKWSFNIIIDMT